MAIDQAALDSMVSGKTDTPTLRFFQWSEPTVTYGYLLKLEDVQSWSTIKNPVKRPTGGGAVLHSPNDLSLSLLWPRASKFFPDNPRECYAAIHMKILHALNETRHPGESRDPGFQLFSREKVCAPETNRFSVCFQEPVCNDLMLEGKKIVGGALRVTKRAMLYQGTIQLPGANTSAMTRLRSTLPESLRRIIASI